MTTLNRLLIAAALAAASWNAYAALGPENVLIVANASDATSVRIAREYAGLRQVPASNLVMLRNVPGGTTISLGDFRSAILGPILTEMRTRHLTRQIACIAYSSGFPYAVDVSAAMAGHQFPRYITQPASLTGLTYLYSLLDASEPLFLAMDANWYHRGIRSAARPIPYSAQDAAARAELDAILARIQPSLHASPRPPEVEADLKRALELARGLSARHVDDGALAYDLACLYALGGMQDRAMEALQLAVRGGWMNVAHTEADPDLVSLHARADFRALTASMRAMPIRLEMPSPFRPGSRWGPGGQPTSSSMGRTYMPACMLAYIGNAANSEDEAIACLRRSAAADYRRPRGTIYFMVSSDRARTGPRQWAFEPARQALSALGVRAEVLSGVLPEGKDDVAGAVVGAAVLDWKSSRSRILPGAFCDHLTSFAGVMTGAGQTLLSEWIRYGAAGSSGTVTEPYAIAAKFPSALLHVFYAHGCTLVEAFYQSVSGPYQQLLVGDPLCAPWAKPVTVRVKGIGPDAMVKRSVKLTVSATGPGPVSRVELYIDGVLTSTARAGTPIRLNPAGLRPGWHEARIVAVAGAQDWRGRSRLRFRVAAD
jgi:hypothetical protein